MKRSLSIPHRLPLWIILLLTVIYTAPYLAPRRAMIACHTDCFLPWRKHATEAERERALRDANRLLTDKLFMFHPAWIFTRECLRSGIPPAWNPWVLCGTPHGAPGTPAAFSPQAALHLALPAFQAYGAVAAFHLLLAGIFFHLFLASLGVRRSAALLGAMVYAFGGWMSAHLEYDQIAGAAAWMPLGLYGLERLLATGRARFAALLAFGVGFSFLSGFPQVSMEILYLYGAYALCRLPGLASALGRGPAIRRMLAAAAGVLLGLLIAAPQLLPTAELLSSGHSTQVSAGLDSIRLRALRPGELTAFLLPDLLGGPYLPVYAASPWNDCRTLLGEAWLGTGSNFNEITLYIGVLFPCLILGMPRSWRIPAAAFGLLLGAVGVLAACDTVVLAGVYHLPGLDGGDPKCFLLLFVAGLALAGAVAFDRFLRRSEEGRDTRTPAAVALLLALAAAVLAFMLQGRGAESFLLGRLAARFGMPPEKAADFLGPERIEGGGWHLILCLWTLAGTAFAAACILLVSGWRRTLPQLRAALPLLFVGAELCLFAYRIDRPQSTEGLLRPTALTGFLKDRPPEEGPLRIVRYRDADTGMEAILPPNLSMLEGIEDVQGAAALSLGRYRDLVECLEPGLAESTGLRSLKTPEALASPILDLLGARYVLCPEAPDPLPSGFAAKGTLDGVTILENREALPRAFVVPRIRYVSTPGEALDAVQDPAFHPGVEGVIEGGEGGEHLPSTGWTATPFRVTWKTRSPVREVLDADSGGGLLVVTENLYPGWQAKVDGRPAALLRADYAFRGVVLPPGRHRVEFSFRSRAMSLGLVLGLLALGGAVFLLSRGRSPPRPSKGKPCNT